MTAVLRENVRTMFEHSVYMEVSDASRGASCLISFNGYDYTGLSVSVGDFGTYDTDDAMIPVFARKDENTLIEYGRVGIYGDVYIPEDFILNIFYIYKVSSKEIIVIFLLKY